MRSRTSRSISVLLASALGIALVAGACSNDDKSASGEDSASESTKVDQDDGDKSSGEDSEAESGEPEVSAEDFSAALAEATEAVNDAADACELYAASATVQIDRLPETSDEAREYVDFNVVLFNKMADTASDDATAEALRKGAENFKDYAESVDFDLDKLNEDSDGEPFEGASEMREVLNKYSEEMFSKCPPPEGAPTPEGVPAPEDGAAG